MFLVLYTGNLFISLSLIGVLAKSASGMAQKLSTCKTKKLFLLPQLRHRSFFHLFKCKNKKKSLKKMLVFLFRST
jgi:hypothetical protein